MYQIYNMYFKFDFKFKKAHGQKHQYIQHTFIQVFCNNEEYGNKKCLLVSLWDMSVTNYISDGIHDMIISFYHQSNSVAQVHL